jgi:hypothetical protein
MGAFFGCFPGTLLLLGGDEYMYSVVQRSHASCSWSVRRLGATQRVPQERMCVQNHLFSRFSRVLCWYLCCFA